MSCISNTNSNTEIIPFLPLNVFCTFVHLHYFCWHRERDQCLKSGSVPNKRGWPDSPQVSSNLIKANTPLWSTKCINLHTFSLNLLLPRPLRPPFLPLTFNLRNLMPFQDMTIMESVTMNLSPLENSHLTFFPAQCFTSIQYCWHYITLTNSPFQP